MLVPASSVVTDKHINFFIWPAFFTTFEPTFSRTSTRSGVAMPLNINAAYFLPPGQNGLAYVKLLA